MDCNKTVSYEVCKRCQKTNHVSQSGQVDLEKQRDSFREFFYPDVKKGSVGDLVFVESRWEGFCKNFVS